MAFGLRYSRWAGTSIDRPKLIRYWAGTIIEQSWLARLFMRIAYWIDGVPKEWPYHAIDN